MPIANLRRRHWVVVSLLLVCGGTSCTSPLFRGQSPESDDLDELVELSEREGETRLVGDLAIPWGLNWLKVEGVGLVTQLNGTGSDPAPSPLREKLINEMQKHEVRRYKNALASPDTSMVVVRGYIPPGARKDDTFDVEVRTPSRSTTGSLQEGWLLRARMRELRVLDTVREGHVSALALGPILVDSLFNASDEEVGKKRGRIPGGGVVQKSRPLGLAISNEHSSVRTSRMIGAAINARFHHTSRDAREGVANPKRDNLIELAVHPLYRTNLGRYIRVIRSIAVGESPAERSARILTLQQMLLDPTSAEIAALQLEAIGSEATDVLKRGLQSPEAEVRFYAAEALAYLDHPDAATPLRNAAESERAFRWRALTAMAAMDSYEAEDAIASLLHVPSAETRYGAFRALRARNHQDPLVRGKILAEEFGFHQIASREQPLLHFARARRPELVVFGDSVQLRPPSFLYAGSSILIKGVDDNTVRLSCFRPGEEDQYKVCSTDIGDIVASITELGGGYADVFEALKAAKEQGYLDARLEVDAIPRANRRYEKPERDLAQGGDPPRRQVANRIPQLFSDRLGSDSDDDDNRAELAADIDPPEQERTKPGIFGRLTSWFR